MIYHKVLLAIHPEPGLRKPTEEQVAHAVEHSTAAEALSEALGCQVTLAVSYRRCPGCNAHGTDLRHLVSGEDDAAISSDYQCTICGMCF